MSKVKSIDPASDRAERLAAAIDIAVKSIKVQLGKHLAGFVVVGWDMRGEACLDYSSEQGPIAKSLLPSYLKDVLMQRVAADGMVSEGEEE